MNQRRSGGVEGGLLGGRLQRTIASATFAWSTSWMNIIDGSEAHQYRTVELIVSSANEPDDPTTKSETACTGIGIEAAVSQSWLETLV